MLKKGNIDRLTLFSICSLFDLLHADIANIKFLAKSAVDPFYCLIFLDLFTSKTYTYPMKKRNLLQKKMEQFYNDIEEKSDLNKVIRLQTDLEYQQNDIKKLNKKYYVVMFSTRVSGGKAFAAEQKIREFKKMLLKTKILSKRNKNEIQPSKIIEQATNSINKTKSEKYDIDPNTIEKKVFKITIIEKYTISNR